MEPIFSYFPTKSLKKTELRFRQFLIREKKRLEDLSNKRKGRALDQDNLQEELPFIFSFSADYHRFFMDYLQHVLPQYEGKIFCGPDCKNCCHHYPLSVAPFELISFYGHLRNSASMFERLEECLFRVKCFYELLEQSPEDDAEEAALHRYFFKNYACPFSKSTGGCSVYEYRPVTCRMYFSLTPAAYCVPEHLQTEQNKNFIVYLPDDIEALIEEISKHYSFFKLPESFYEGLLAVNSLESSFYFEQESGNGK